jgi:hypothetical protein
MKNQQPATTERYLHAVRDVVVARARKRGTITASQAERLAHTKLLYGVGDGTYRGVTVFDAWQNGVGRVDIVEIAATGQESWIQLAGTVIHELAHVLAGGEAGHSTTWKDTAVGLGFAVRPAAAGQVYHLAMIHPTIRHAVHAWPNASGTGGPSSAPSPSPPCPPSHAPLGRHRHPGRPVTRQGIRLEDAAVAVRMRHQAGQGPCRLRRLPSHLRPVWHRV